MAIVTGVAAGDVGRVLAGGNDTVMTGTTSTDYRGVIYQCYFLPTRRTVAIGAFTICRDVVWRLD